MSPNLTHLLDPIPGYITVSFIGVTVLTLALFFLAIRQNRGARWFLAGSVIWLGALAILAQQGFFLELNAFPPRLILAVAPALIFVFVVGLTTLGKSLTHKATLTTLTWLHTIRFPVELLLFALYTHEQVPERMTFAGGNLDILSGLSAPLMVYIVLARQWVPWRWLLAWNVVAIGLLLNVVIPAVLSLPSPLQTMAFDQPNVAVLKAPLVWLPAFVVPIVLLAHFVAIRKLLTD